MEEERPNSSLWWGLENPTVRDRFDVLSQACDDTMVKHPFHHRSFWRAMSELRRNKQQHIYIYINIPVASKRVTGLDDFDDP